MRVALYARVSTDDQTVAPQIDVLREYSRARGLEVVDEFIDHGVSGAKDRRPALDEMMAKAKRRSFDAVAVVRLDRLGRSLHHLLTLLGELETLGIDLISLDDGLDTSTPVGRFFFQIRGAFAEFERALMMERTAAGVAAARRRGSRFGRPSALSRSQRERATRLRGSGQSIRAIADILGVSKSVVGRALSRQSVAEGAKSVA